MKYFFRTKLVNDKNFKRNGEEVEILDISEDKINLQIKFQDGTITHAYSAEVLDITDIKELCRKNMETEDSNIGFDYKGAWITNPFYDETARFEFPSFDMMCQNYGLENINRFIQQLLSNL